MEKISVSEIIWCPFCKSTGPFLEGHLTACSQHYTRNPPDKPHRPPFKPCNTRMGDVCRREASFINQQFPLWPTTDIADLTQCGFYFSGDRDICICFFCNVYVGNWQENDSVLERHLNANPGCIYVIDLCKSISFCEYCRKLVPKPKKPSIRDIFKHEDRCLKTRIETRGPPETFPRNPDMVEFLYRLKTFRAWAEHVADHDEERVNNRVLQLTETGFYHAGPRRKSVKCFYCDGTVDDSILGKDPLTDPKIHLPVCQFANKTAEGEREEKNDSANLCKICWSEDRTVVFKNCCHMLSCSTCAKKLKKCPVCCQPILRRMRVYLC